MATTLNCAAVGHDEDLGLGVGLRVPGCCHLLQAEQLHRTPAHLHFPDLPGDRHRELVDHVHVFRDLVVRASLPVANVRTASAVNGSAAWGRSVTQAHSSSP